jgi:hypothetical protein
MCVDVCRRGYNLTIVRITHCFYWEIGGCTRTRTVDPLIKSYPGREQFQWVIDLCRRVVYTLLKPRNKTLLAKKNAHSFTI